MFSCNVENQKKIQYIIEHRNAIAKLEMALRGKVSTATVFHDFDKIIMLRIGIKPKLAKHFHRFWSKHHVRSFWSARKKDVWGMFLDWESARFTKPDKPLAAVEFARKTKPEYVEIMMLFEDRYKDVLEKL